MTINVKAPNGILLAEVDSDTIFSSRLKTTLHPCPECKLELAAVRDGGRWYLIGTGNCLVCRGLFSLPSEEELADMLKKAEQT